MNPIAARIARPNKLPAAASTPMTVTTISQLTGNLNRANTAGVILGSNSTQAGLIQHVNKKETKNWLSACRNGECIVTSAKATVMTAAIAAFTMASRPQNV